MDWGSKIKLFFKVLLGVLTVGFLSLCIWSAFSGDKDTIIYEVIEFSSIAFEKVFEPKKEVQTITREDIEEREVNLLFAGDILLDDNYSVMSNMKLRGGELVDAFSVDLINRMQNADIFMINNEFTFSDRGAPLPGKKFTFRAKTQNVDYFNQMGVDVVSVANNHIYDYGEISLLDTLETLEGANIAHVGAGRNLEEAMRPYFTEVGGNKIAFVSATQIEKLAIPDTKGATENSAGVLRCLEPDKLLETISAAKAESDFVVLYIHWGTESQEEIDWLQKEQVLVYAQAGVDLIIGDHPHCLQKIDVISGVPVVYSLGNFWFNSKTQNTCLIEAAIKGGELKQLKFIPCRQSECKTDLLYGNDALELIKHINEISPNVNINDEGIITW